MIKKGLTEGEIEYGVFEKILNAQFKRRIFK